MSTQALAERPKQTPNRELVSFIQSDTIQAQLAMALPRYYTADQFTVIVRTAINKNPKLAQCEPTSFLTSMLTAAQMGLAVNGREAHLIPRWNGRAQQMECTFQPDYKGYVKLIRLNDNVADVYAVNVRKNDVFRITQGLHRDIVHEPDYTKDQGEIIGVYAVILYKDGLSSWEFLPRTEVESIRARSESWKAHIDKGYDTPWKTDEGEMFKKTAIKRVAKLADLSPDTMERLNADNELEFVKPAAATEIKHAQIPGAAAPALEAGGSESAGPRDTQEGSKAAAAVAQAQEVQVEVEPAPAAAKPEAAKKPAKLGKKAPEPAAAAPAPEPEPNENPKITEIRNRLEKGGYTVELYVEALKVFDLSEADVAFATATEETLDAILENWDQLEEELQKVAQAA